MAHREHHFTNRLPIVRSMVMGANDGIISISALVLGLASAKMGDENLFIAGSIGLISGAISMAAGEYLSVSAQKDSELADINREKEALANNPEEEHDELIEMFKQKGLSGELSQKVAEELRSKNKALLNIHLKEELGIGEEELSSPILAAFVSFISFTTGGSIPIIASRFFENKFLVTYLIPMSVIALVLLGILSAITGGSSKLKGAIRVGIVGSTILVCSLMIGGMFG